MPEYVWFGRDHDAESNGIFSGSNVMRDANATDGLSGSESIIAWLDSESNEIFHGSNVMHDAIATDGLPDSESFVTCPTAEL